MLTPGIRPYARCQVPALVHSTGIVPYGDTGPYWYLACATPPTVSVGERAGLPLAGSAVAPPRRAERGLTLRSPASAAPPPHTAPRARAAAPHVGVACARARARHPLGSVRVGAEHARSRARVSTVRYNCENTSHLQFLSDTEIPIYAQNLLHNTK